MHCLRSQNPQNVYYVNSTPRGKSEIWLRLCLSRNMEFPALVLRNFGPFVPGITSSGGVAGEEGEGVRSNRAGCGQLLCTKKCLAAADIYWPQVRSNINLLSYSNVHKSGRWCCELKPRLTQPLSTFIQTLDSDIGVQFQRNPRSKKNNILAKCQVRLELTTG